MAKVTLETQETSTNVINFLNSIKDEAKRKDSFKILEMMKEISGFEPKMWGATIIGFGHELLKYESGRELEWFFIGFSPRKQNLTLYNLINYNLEKVANHLSKLGKHTTGKECLYIKNLTDIDESVLAKLIMESLIRK